MRAHIRRIYTYVKEPASAMNPAAEPPPEACNCSALRQAARHVTQFYDQRLAASGLRTTQMAILARIKRLGPMTINALAAEMVMDRTTLGRNIVPLQRRGLISVETGRADRRSKELHLTKAGLARLGEAAKAWRQAQTEFGAVFGAERAAELRALLRAVVDSDFAGASKRA